MSESEPMPPDDHSADEGAVGTRADTQTEGGTEAEKKKGKQRARAEAAEATAAAAIGSARRWRAIALVCAFVGALLVAAVTVLAIRHSDDQDTIDRQGRLDDARTSVLAAARQYAIDFTTYDYRDLDAGFKRTEAELTGEFKKKYSSTTKALRETIIKYKAKATAVLQGIGVQSLSEHDAVILAFVDQTVTNTTSDTPTVDRNRIRMTLHREGSGPWLITDLQLP